jgi:hypothetical protein
MEISDKILVAVGYYGGYGGSFFCNILRKSLEKESREIVPINNRNEYNFESSALGAEKYTIDVVMKAYDKGFDILLDVEFFERTKDPKYAWNGLVNKVFMECYDVDRAVFCDNLTNYLKKRLRLKTGFNVVNFHYSRKHGGFSIHNIHDRVIFFLLSADNLKHHVLFDLMFNIKQKHFIHPKFVSQSLEDLVGTPRKRQPFDSCHLLDVGKMFLQTKDNGIEEAERIISEAVGMKISLDKEMIEVYSKSNVKLLNEFLSIDIEEAEYRDVLRAAEKKLKSLL